MVKIIPFSNDYANAFKELNYQWINQYFKVEAFDLQMLENPDSYIIQKGGEILIALYHENPVGTCALIKLDDANYELAKMAVSEEARGLKIGWKLGLETIKKAQEMGANRLYLETNSILTPAINLYKKLGFTEIKNEDSAYERCDIRMEMILS